MKSCKTPQLLKNKYFVSSREKQAAKINSGYFQIKRNTECADNKDLNVDDKSDDHSLISITEAALDIVYGESKDI